MLIDQNKGKMINNQAIKLGIGTNKVGGHNLFDNLKDQDGFDVVKEALDSGIAMIDTAYMYGLGRSEDIIGQVIKNYPRENFKIATKAAQDPDNNLTINNDPIFLEKSVNDALSRLQTDYIDIFYIHFPDDKTPKDKAVAALNELKKAGKIRAIGLSNFSLEQIKEANKNNQVDYVEDHYNLIQRHVEREIWPYLKENDIKFVPYFPLASGLLTGKYTIDDADKFKHLNREQFEKIIQILKGIDVIANKHGATVTQIILAWYIKNSEISAVIPGARVPSQVANNVATLKIDLSTDEYQEIDNAFNFL
ncbi:aldo/keto reductase [Leuconostoc gelidum subsp. gelidum]|uniref:Aldo/keto reductase n=1 Tax=Leuconostoc gelidum subsp. gelidum TaxID=1607839 RepID=A0AB35FZC0_LEUGE|nr:aldo/keto reductase [Leuconostoc gelidum]MBZ5963583.1 aldo/keto reductase [Leuconostoc gelidum subsp. gelidum]MBZ5975575.1 aldo/keto reductase [Leuconostoc gelidum subsp. gelidum]MBZ5976257.1 aldo/keto reductase [Leuconostoc gelidum subsp. gelidum]MBZ5987040.1 aldo/keto reductase [Leuconostoc gelidum subsp. gelidum]MBZ6000237.1 aldo/keto reductase [Leuconostoc gelidum subsp. gelidum]